MSVFWKQRGRARPSDLKVYQKDFTSFNKLPKQCHWLRLGILTFEPWGDSLQSNLSRDLMGRLKLLCTKKEKKIRLCNKNCLRAVAKKHSPSEVWFVIALRWKMEEMLKQEELGGRWRDKPGEHKGKKTWSFWRTTQIQLYTFCNRGVGLGRGMGLGTSG